MAAVEAPRWDETETRQRLSMYNESTRCIDRVVFPDQNSAIGYFVLRPDCFPPFVSGKPARTVIFGERPFTEKIMVTDDLVDGHFTPEYGISVVRGIDQLAAALQIHADNVMRDIIQDVRLKRIGEVKFSQPVVPGDTMVIRPLNLSKDYLKGDSGIMVDGVTVTTINGIEFEIVDATQEDMQAEYIKTILIEAGAQTAVADFLFRRDSLSPEEQAKGDFLVYAGIRGPIEFYEDVLPGGEAEIHMVRDSKDLQSADITVWVAGIKVAEILGNECAVGNRERTRQLIDRIVQRRRARF